MNHPPRILVTGASGFLGRQVVDAFRGDHPVSAQGFRRADGLLACDLRERGQVLALLAAAAPDWIIHCSAYREPDFCELNPAEAGRLNVDSTRHLVEGMPAGCRLLFISSDYVFDGTRPPYREADPTAPVNEYGRTKVRGEQLALARPGNLVVRIPVLVGPDPEGVRGFVTQMVDEVRAGLPRVVDHVLVRCPTATRDVAQAVRFLVGRGEPGVWHASAPFAGTRYELTCEVARQLGLDAAHLTPSREVIPRAARRPVDASLDSTRLRSAGFNGLRGLPDMLRDFL